MKILVTGASGLLGANFLATQHRRHTLIGLYNSVRLNDSLCPVMPCDLTVAGAVEKVIEEERPDCILNCAALANIDLCEKAPALAETVNTVLPGRLAGISSRLGIRLVHVSTDAVFDGARGDYSENDAPSPVNVYGRTKLEGERRVLSANPGAVVARVNFFGWSLNGRRSLAEWFYNNLSSGNRISGYADIYFCPLLVNFLCDALVSLAESGASGVFHAVGVEAISKYDFGVRLAAQFGFDSGLIAKASFSKTGDVAQRGGRLTLNVSRFAGVIGARIPGVEESLSTFHALRDEKYPERLRSIVAA